jgi:hypothetical protein
MKKNYIDLFRALFADASGLENWSDISAYVGSKSPEECVKHFLRLPSEGPMDRMYSIHPYLAQC